MSQSITFLVSDPSGRTVGRHTVTSLGNGLSVEQALDLARRSTAISPEHLLTPLPERVLPLAYVRDGERARPASLLYASSTGSGDGGVFVLEGDGRSTLAIDITCRDPAPWVAEQTTPIAELPIDASFSGEVLVTTSRGRLSSRGGRVRLERGVGRIELTSVAETVALVEVTVQDPAGILSSGSLLARFD